MHGHHTGCYSKIRHFKIRSMKYLNTGSAQKARQAEKPPALVESRKVAALIGQQREAVFREFQFQCAVEFGHVAGKTAGGQRERRGIKREVHNYLRLRCSVQSRLIRGQCLSYGIQIV